jgi:hypothetical protein
MFHFKNKIDMNSYAFYSVPEGIALVLGLAPYRRTDGKGNYLLSANDLRAYGLDKALSEGATGILASQVLKQFPLKP